MNREPNDAQRFLEAEHDWLMQTAQQASIREGLRGYGEDIAHEVYNKVQGVSDDKWAGVQNNKAYVATIINNLAKDLRV